MERAGREGRESAAGLQSLGYPLQILADFGRAHRARLRSRPYALSESHAAWLDILKHLWIHGKQTEVYLEPGRVDMREVAATNRLISGRWPNGLLLARQSAPEASLRPLLLCIIMSRARALVTWDIGGLERDDRQKRS